MDIVDAGIPGLFTAYLEHILGYVDRFNLMHMRSVVNSGSAGSATKFQNTHVRCKDVLSFGEFSLVGYFVSNLTLCIPFSFFVPKASRFIHCDFQ